MTLDGPLLQAGASIATAISGTVVKDKDEIQHLRTMEIVIRQKELSC
jgi:hypothetical protein